MALPYDIVYLAVAFILTCVHKPLGNICVVGSSTKSKCVFAASVVATCMGVLLTMRCVACSGCSVSLHQEDLPFLRKSYSTDLTSSPKTRVAVTTAKTV